MSKIKGVNHFIQVASIVLFLTVLSINLSTSFYVPAAGWSVAFYLQFNGRKDTFLWQGEYFIGCNVYVIGFKKGFILYILHL